MPVAYFKKLLLLIGALACLSAFRAAAQPTATITSDVSAVCQGGASPVITFTGSGGNAPYTFDYNINGGSTQTITTSVGSSVTLNVPTGAAGAFTYKLEKVTDADLATQAQTDAVTVTINAPPSVKLGAFADV